MDKLKRVLGQDDVNLPTKERYELNWVGKQAAYRTLQAPSYHTLAPVFDDSVNFDTTQNLFIESDNLEALKLLQKSYYGQVKMIYIDPPYNTGNDFVYNDNFRSDKKSYQQQTGEMDANGNYLTDHLFKNKKENGHYHSNWLSMMLPRLHLARNLLSDDGVIFISIDDNEQAQLKLLCDEVFGAENFVACLPTIMNLKGNNDEFGFAGTHEYTFVFCKNKDMLLLNEFNINESELNEWNNDEIGFYKQGANLKSTGVNAPREKRPNLFFPIFIDDEDNVYVTENNAPPKEYIGNLITVLPITDNKEMSWRWSKHKFLLKNSDIIISRNGNNLSLYKKQRPSLGDLPSKKPKTIFYKPEYSSGNGTAILKEILTLKAFPNPKPLELLKDFMRLGMDKGGLVLDFFAGSSTTAHAVMQLNAEDGGNRQFIMVQLPEPTDEKSEAYKAGFANIAEISKERIRRAGAKIKADNPDKSIDTGFKVFKLAQSNFKQWQSPKGDIQSQLALFVNNVVDDASDEAIVYEIILRLGLPLTVTIAKAERVYWLDDSHHRYAVVVNCLDDFGAIIAQNPIKIVALDRAFKNDVQKSNTLLQCQDAGIELLAI